MRPFCRALRRVRAVWVVGLTTISASAQPADTTVFSAADFYAVVAQYHPLARQAALLSDEARQGVVQARGAFDPKLFSYYDKKQFGNTLYYDKWQSGVAVPILPGGVDLKVTHDRNTGAYLNAEDRITTSGLTAVGISVPVGQGLLIDARRNALRQAQLAVSLADADRLKLINKTLFDAAKTYWEWYFADRQYRLVSEGYQLADRRFQAIRQRARLGDAAPIDTTEALITVQDRLVGLRQAVVDRQNARLRLTAFLWNEQGEAVDIPATVVPQASVAGGFDEATRQRLLDRATGQHPDLLKLTTKRQQLAIEERFRRSLLQPQLNVGASLLSGMAFPGFGSDNAGYYGFRPDNHKLTLDVVFPLFLRKERGKLREVQIKSRQLDLDRQQTARDITIDIQSIFNDIQMLDGQLVVQQQIVANQRALVRAEQQKFELGESSLFLVNARETKLIDLGVKLEELRTKYQKAAAALWYAAGTNQTAAGL
ncbi:MAG: TolC family protein [Bacteroidetes bacterium]|nr:TolC family protein [Fibrella sp.]